MSVSLLEVLEKAGYDVTNNLEDAKWLLNREEEFDELLEKAEELYDSFYEYNAEKDELLDTGRYSEVKSFEEWRKAKNAE